MTTRPADELRGLQDHLKQLGGGVAPVVARVVDTVAPPLRTLLGYSELAAAFLPQLRELLHRTAAAAPQVKAAVVERAAALPAKATRNRLLAAGVMLGVGAMIYLSASGSKARRSARP